MRVRSLSRLVEMEEEHRLRGEEEERLRLEAEVAAKLLTGAEERLRKATDAGDDEAELGGALEQAQAVGVSNHMMWMAQAALSKLQEVCSISRGHGPPYCTAVSRPVPCRATTRAINALTAL